MFLRHFRSAVYHLFVVDHKDAAVLPLMAIGVASSTVEVLGDKARPSVQRSHTPWVETQTRPLASVRLKGTAAAPNEKDSVVERI